jgi:hypothetical protein
MTPFMALPTEAVCGRGYCNDLPEQHPNDARCTERADSGFVFRHRDFRPQVFVPLL